MLACSKNALKFPFPYTRSLSFSVMVMLAGGLAFSLSVAHDKLRAREVSTIISRNRTR